MAISEMSITSFIALKKERNALFDVLSATGAAQIKKCADYEFLAPRSVAAENIGKSDDDARKALNFLDFCYEELGDKKRAPVITDGFGVGIKDFIEFGKKAGEVEREIKEILDLSDEYSVVKTEISKLDESVKAYLDYECLSEKFSFYSSTKSTAVFVGVISSDKASPATDALNEIDGAVAEIAGENGSKCVLTAVCLKGRAEEVGATIAKYSFTKCPYTDDKTAKEIIDDLGKEKTEKENRLKAIIESGVEKIRYSADIKTYVDYLGFVAEKEAAGADCGETRETFLAEFYVPTEAVERVEKTVRDNASAVYIESKVVPRSEFAPTLMKNKRPTSDFEAITNMYSAPAYGALDPNCVMGIFFSLFMGIIMGDAGYGVLMIIGGFLMAAKSRKGTSIYRMARVFAYGGFFAVAFGTLFDSFLGFQPLHNIPAYVEFYDKYVDPIRAKCTLAGITVPSALMWCLAIGTFQIAVSLLMKAAQCFRRKQYVEGIFSGIVWSLALICFILLVFFMIKGDKAITNYLLYPTLALFAVGILTSGITEKGFGKVTKTFGSLYGLINYASDILSYARLYGLMLAGAQIASIFTNSIAVGMLFPKGVGGIIGGVVVIIVGNVFNLAMNLLGAFIHDSRLQYVEFFGRFYEGEGELFAPLGSQREFIYFK